MINRPTPSKEGFYYLQAAVYTLSKNWMGQMRVLLNSLSQWLQPTSLFIVIFQKFWNPNFAFCRRDDALGENIESRLPTRLKKKYVKWWVRQIPNPVRRNRDIRAARERWSRSTVRSSDPDRGRVEAKWSLNPDPGSASNADPRSRVESPYVSVFAIYTASAHFTHRCWLTSVVKVLSYHLNH